MLKDLSSFVEHHTFQTYPTAGPARVRVQSLYHVQLVTGWAVAPTTRSNIPVDIAELCSCFLPFLCDACIYTGESTLATAVPLIATPLHPVSVLPPLLFKRNRLRLMNQLINGHRSLCQVRRCCDKALFEGKMSTHSGRVERGSLTVSVS